MTLTRYAFCAAIVSAAIFFLAAPSRAALASDEPRAEPLVLGYQEDVSVGRRGLDMKAKLDTGADTSSVHARNIRLYKRGKKDNWVHFRLIGKNGRSIRYDQNVIRFVHIKSKKGGTVRRPVIRLPLCVGGVRALAEVNLANREDFDFDVLIGREFLADRILVDSSKTFIANKTCEMLDDD